MILPSVSYVSVLFPNCTKAIYALSSGRYSINLVVITFFIKIVIEVLFIPVSQKVINLKLNMFGLGYITKEIVPCTKALFLEKIKSKQR